MNLGKLWLICGAFAAWAQAPEIDRNGVVNAAGGAPSAAVDSEIARGSLLIIRGARFGSRLPEISGKLAGMALPIVSVAPSALTARVPANAPLGPASLTLVVNGQSCRPFPVQVVAAQFGAYAVNGRGWGPGRIQNIAEKQRAPNTVSHAADLGQTLALSGTGLGDAKSPTVWVGSRQAQVLGIRTSADGDEILFSVPPNAPEGCFVPVQVQNAGSRPSNTVTAAIQKGGGACREPGYFPFAGWTGTRFGMVTITRTVKREKTGQTLSDEAGAWFGRLSSLEQLNPYFLLPPPGTCTSQLQPWRGEPVPSALVPQLASHSGIQSLEAGTEISINDGGTMRKVPALRGASGAFERPLTDLLGRPDPLFRLLSPAVIHVAGQGGADVGAFHVALPGLQPFDLHTPVASVRKGQPLRLEWTGMDAGHIPIVAVHFVDETAGSRGMCYCTGTPGAASLTVPAAALAYFPTAGRGAHVTITVAAWPLRPVSFQAAGLEHGIALSAYMQEAVGDILPGR